VLVRKYKIPNRVLGCFKDITLTDINKALSPYGFRLKFWGVHTDTLEFVYQYVPRDESYYIPTKDLVLCYHHTDYLPEWWASELLRRHKLDSHECYASLISRKQVIMRKRKKEYKKKRTGPKSDFKSLRSRWNKPNKSKSK